MRNGVLLFACPGGGIVMGSWRGEPDPRSMRIAPPQSARSRRIDRAIAAAPRRGNPGCVALAAVRRVSRCFPTIVLRQSPPEAA